MNKDNKHRALHTQPGTGPSYIDLLAETDPCGAKALRASQRLLAQAGAMTKQPTTPEESEADGPAQLNIQGNVYELVEFFDHDSQKHLIALRFVAKGKEPGRIDEGDGFTHSDPARSCSCQPQAQNTFDSYIDEQEAETPGFRAAVEAETKRIAKSMQLDPQAQDAVELDKLRSLLNDFRQQSIIIHASELSGRGEKGAEAFERSLSDAVQRLNALLTSARLDSAIGELETLQLMLDIAPKWRNGYMKEPVPYWSFVKKSLKSHLAALQAERKKLMEGK